MLFNVCPDWDHSHLHCPSMLKTCANPKTFFDRLLSNWMHPQGSLKSVFVCSPFTLLPTYPTLPSTYLAFLAIDWPRVQNPQKSHSYPEITTYLVSAYLSNHTCLSLLPKQGESRSQEEWWNHQTRIQADQGIHVRQNPCSLSFSSLPAFVCTKTWFFFFFLFWRFLLGIPFFYSVEYPDDHVNVLQTNDHVNVEQDGGVTVQWNRKKGKEKETLLIPSSYPTLISTQSTHTKHTTFRFRLCAFVWSLRDRWIHQLGDEDPAIR